MKRKIISLLCAVAALSVIMTFTGMQASAKTIAPDVKLNYTSYEYTGSPLGPGVKVYDENADLLTYNEDYTVKYNGERIQPGTYSVTVSFIGEYEGTESVTKEFDITDSKVNVKLNYTSYEYAGKPLGPGLTVTDSKGKVLTLNKDYTVKYNGERIQPGTYSVTITLKGDYSGTVEKDFTITASKVNVKLNYTSYKYTGYPLGPGFTVTDSSGKVLQKNVDYTYQYSSGRIEPGTYYVTITLKGDYYGKIVKYFEITDSKVNVKLNRTSYVYAGIPLGPGFTVTDSNGRVLTKNVDYTYQYSAGRIEPGTYYVTITLKGNYYGKIVKYFEITENKINVKLNRTSYEYAGKPLGPGLTVTDSRGNTLVRNKDYTLKYNGTRILPGTYSVTITFTGDYRYYEPITKEYTITDSKVNVKLNRTSYVYAGIPLGPGFTVTDSSGKVLTKNKDYTYQYSSGRIEPGTYSVKITLKGSYYGTIEKNFTITENVFSVKLNYTNYEYTGSPLGPGLTVKDSKGNTLKLNEDFTVKYNGERIEIGTYSVTVTLIGNYRGSKTLSFTIGPKGVSDSSVKASGGRRTVNASWSTMTDQTNGYQVQCSAYSDFRSVKTVTVSPATKNSASITGLSDSTKYYVRVRTYKTIDGVNYYSNWSSAASAQTLRNEIVDVAESQLGYSGGKKYWSWAGYSSRVAWCNIFVTWCANECGYYKSGAVPLYQQPQDTLEWYQDRGLFKKRGNYTPKPGDLIFFNWGYSYAHHIGIVEKCENGKVYTIEGNSRDVVKRQTYSINSVGIIGYATPKYN